MGYNIGSFNLHNIGVNALLNNNPRDLAKIATIIKNEGFDVVALQEIRSEGKAFTLEKQNLKKIQKSRKFSMNICITEECLWQF